MVSNRAGSSTVPLALLLAAPGGAASVRSGRSGAFDEQSIAEEDDESLRRFEE